MGGGSSNDLTKATSVSGAVAALTGDAPRKTIDPHPRRTVTDATATRSWFCRDVRIAGYFPHTVSLRLSPSE